MAGVFTAGLIGDAARRAEQETSRLTEIEQTATAGGWMERRHARRDLPEATAAATAAADRLAGLVAAEHCRLDQEIGGLQTTLDALDQRSLTAARRWQRAAGEHAAAAGSQQRLGRVLEATRRCLEQPDQPERTTRHRRTPGTWQPAPRHVLKPEPTEATHEAPGL